MDSQKVEVNNNRSCMHKILCEMDSQKVEVNNNRSHIK